MKKYLFFICLFSYAYSDPIVIIPGLGDDCHFPTMFKVSDLI